MREGELTRSRNDACRRRGQTQFQGQVTRSTLSSVEWVNSFVFLFYRQSYANTSSDTYISLGFFAIGKSVCWTLDFRFLFRICEREANEWLSALCMLCDGCWQKSTEIPAWTNNERANVCSTKNCWNTMIMSQRCKCNASKLLVCEQMHFVWTKCIGIEQCEAIRWRSMC